MDGEWSAGMVEAFLHQRIPPAQALGIRVAGLESGRVELRAPLDVNHNHLGTAFGGSLAAVVTLAGYVALWTALRDHEIHVVVRRSEIDYLKPVRGEIRAVCELPQAGLGSTFLKSFRSRGKARLMLPVRVIEEGEECVRFRGEFVALR